MNSNQIQIESTESELLYNAVFQQIQECGDIISSILIIHTFIKENNINVTFNTNDLRQIALRSVHNDTSTYLWHINALIAVSADFEHLLLGIEIMFDRFLGNKQLFIKEKEKKQKSKSSITAPNQLNDTQNLHKSQRNQNNKFLGNEIVSFVNTYYDHNADDDRAQPQESQKGPELDQTPQKADYRRNDENENQQNKHLYVGHNDNDNDGKMKQIDDNSKEYLKNYRGKISSPISFRLRQQKRMMQSERRLTSRNASRNASIDLDSFGMDRTDKRLDFGHGESMNVSSNSFEPEILSPFNVSKFAKTVDLMSNDIDSATFHRKNV